MHAQQPQARPRVPGRTVVSVLTMLVGIVVLIFGYLGDNRTALIAGLVITLAGLLPAVLGIIAGTRTPGGK